MEVNLFINEKKGNPTDDELILNLKFGYLLVNFHPPTINTLIKQLWNLRNPNSEDFELILKSFEEKF